MARIKIRIGSSLIVTIRQISPSRPLVSDNGVQPAVILVTAGTRSSNRQSSLSLLNQAPESAYFAQTLATWEQGRFIRFHGLAQWLGWLWPIATLAYVLAALSRRTRPA